MMSYVIAKKNQAYLNTPVFYAGQSDADEAVAVFTDRKAAADYINAAGWETDHEVGELDALQLLRWIVAAHEGATQFVTVNPDRERQMANEKQPVIDIEETLADFAESLTKKIVATAFTVKS